VIAQLRICVPEELSGAVIDCCSSQSGVAEVGRHPGASVIPPGDVILVLLARESVELLVEKLHALKVGTRAFGTCGPGRGGGAG
jgi:hypothetical protein